MAKVVNAPLGELSGKLGGVVYSRNKSGAIVRANTKGVNPLNITRARARALFGSVTRVFRTLSGAEKTGWQEFADNYYVPKTGLNTGQFSGYNAFQALRALVQQAYRVVQTGDISVNAGAAIAATTITNYTPMPETPIAKSFTGAIKEAVTNEALALQLNSVTVAENGAGNFVLQVSDGTGHDLAGIISPENYVMGFAIYMSNGNPSEGMSYQNRFSHCLGYRAPEDADTPGTDLTAVETLTFNFDNTYNRGHVKRFPLLNEYVMITVMAVNLYGQLAMIDSLETQIS